MRGIVPRRPPRLDVDAVDAKGPGFAAFCLWLVVLVLPLRDVLAGEARPAWPAGLALAALAVLYVATLWAAFDDRPPLWAPAGLLVAMTALAMAVVPAFDWYPAGALLGLAAGVVVGRTPRRFRGFEWRMALGLGGVTGAMALAAWLGGGDGGALVGVLSSTGTPAAVTAIVLRLFAVIGMLRAAREELARAAIERERLRFSRDLHDLLGHTLSVMVVKAQAVRLVAGRDPAVAAAQAADIETIGRQALTEVRQAVAGYRGRGLDAELDAARIALADAGIVPVVRRSGPPPPPDRDALLGWAVREGVTNAVRHSRAEHCTITVRSDGDRAVLEVRDDGSGPPASGADGNGLRGLAERMATAGGTVRTGSGPDGGFVLTVMIPTTPEPTPGPWTGHP